MYRVDGSMALLEHVGHSIILNSRTATLTILDFPLLSPHLEISLQLQLTADSDNIGPVSTGEDRTGRTCNVGAREPISSERRQCTCFFLGRLRTHEAARQNLPIGKRESTTASKLLIHLAHDTLILDR